MLISRHTTLKMIASCLMMSCFQANTAEIGTDDDNIQYQKGIDLRNAGQREQALSYFLPLAEKGHVRAQHNAASQFWHLGDMHGAYYWFKKAASQGFQPSLSNLEKLNFFKELISPVLTDHLKLFLQEPDDSSNKELDFIFSSGIDSAGNKGALSPIDEIFYLQSRIFLSIKGGGWNKCFDYLDQSVSHIIAMDNDYVATFIAQAESGARGQSQDLDQTKRVNRTLLAWALIFCNLKDNRQGRLVGSFMAKFIPRFLDEHPNLFNKLSLLWVINQPRYSTLVSPIKNYYYKPGLVRKFFETLSAEQIRDENTFLQALMFDVLNRNDYDRFFNRPEPGQKDPFPIKEALENFLSKTNNYWMKLLFMSNDSFHHSFTPVPGSPMAKDEIRDLLGNNPNALDFAVAECEDSLNRRFSPSPQLLVDDPEALEILKTIFTHHTVVYDNIIVREAMDFIVDHVIQNNEIETAQRIIRLFENKGGWVRVHERLPDLEIFIHLKKFADIPESQSLFIPYLTRLANLVQSNHQELSQPLRAELAQIQESTSLTPTQLDILKKLNDIKTLEQTGSTAHFGPYQKMYGPVSIISNFYFIRKGFMEISESYTSPSHLIVQGPVFIKTKAFKLSGTAYAQDGAVVVAESFDLENGTINNPDNWHFIKVPKVRLDDSEILTD